MLAFKKLDDKEKERVIRAGFDAVVPHLAKEDAVKYAPYEQVRDDCLEYFRTGKFPQSRKSPPKVHSWTARPRNLVAVKDEIDPCKEKQKAVAIDTVCVLIGICGIDCEVARSAAEKLVNGISMIEIEQMVEAFSTASSFWDYCAAVGNVGSTMWDYFSISALLQALKDNMQWYDWIIASVTLTATIEAMFTSGAALAAEVALNVAGIDQITKDVIAMRSACGI